MHRMIEQIRNNPSSHHPSSYIYIFTLTHELPESIETHQLGAYHRHPRPKPTIQFNLLYHPKHNPRDCGTASWACKHLTTDHTQPILLLAPKVFSCGYWRASVHIRGRDYDRGS